MIEADRPLEARAVARDLRKIDAFFEIDRFLDRMPFRRTDMRDQLARNYTRALEQGGLQSSAAG